MFEKSNLDRSNRKTSLARPVNQLLESDEKEQSFFGGTDKLVKLYACGSLLTDDSAAFQSHGNSSQDS